MSAIEGYKCDVCGKVYVQGEKPPYYQDPSSAKIEINTPFDNGDMSVDLKHVCSSCITSLKSAISNVTTRVYPGSIS
jgi:hypothetical protein